MRKAFRNVVFESDAVIAIQASLNGGTKIYLEGGAVLGLDESPTDVCRMLDWPKLVAPNND